MTERRKTPLKQPRIEGHHCTLDVRIDRLSGVPFFAGLDRKSVEQISRKFSAHHFAEEEVIYHQEEPAAWLRIVVFGSVRLIHHTDTGRDILLDLLKPGEYFGTLPLLGEDSYRETAYAHTDSCIMTISQPEFEKVLQDFPAVAIRLIEVSVRRLQAARERIQYLTVSTVEKRIASILETLAGKFGEQKETGILIQIPLSRKQLADMTGTTPETASRVISRFEQEGVLKTGRRWVALTDAARLKELMEE